MSSVRPPVAFEAVLSLSVAFEAVLSLCSRYEQSLLKVSIKGNRGYLCRTRDELGASRASSPVRDCVASGTRHLFKPPRASGTCLLCVICQVVSHNHHAFERGTHLCQAL